MATSSVAVQITGFNNLGPAFTSANATIKQFEHNASNSFHEARGAADLFGDAVGVRLNKHLSGIIAQSQILGPLFELAFPIAALAGFIELGEKLGEKMDEIINKTKELERVQKEAAKAIDESLKLDVQAQKDLKDAAQAGASEQQKLAVAADDLRGKIEKQAAVVRAYRDALFDLQNTGSTRDTVLGFKKDDIPQLNTLLGKAEDQL